MNKTAELNLTNIPKELKLILEIIKIDSNDRIIKECLEGIDWDLFLQQAIHHRLYPLLYPKIIKMENSWLPLNIIESLSRHYKRNTFQMLHLCGEMEYLSKLLMENSIRPLFLKGPVLATDLYGEISMRTCGDLDILIPIDDVERANEVLSEIGYKKEEYIPTLLNDWKWRQHHFTYYHPMKGTKIEVHWRLNPVLSKEPTFNDLWRRKRKSSITTNPTYFMGKEDLFFFLVSHGSRHGWSRLRWLVDIHQIVKKDLNWDELTKLLKRYQSLHIAGQSLTLSSQLLNTSLTKDMQQLIRGSRTNKIAQDAIFFLERMVNLHTDPVPEDIANFHTKHLLSLMSFRQKVVYYLSMLHPYYIDAETMPLPKKLHFLYFPLRPFLWAWRKTMKHELP